MVEMAIAGFHNAESCERLLFHELFSRVLGGYIVESSKKVLRSICVNVYAYVCEWRGCLIFVKWKALIIYIKFTILQLHRW